MNTSLQQLHLSSNCQIKYNSILLKGINTTWKSWTLKLNISSNCHRFNQIMNAYKLNKKGRRNECKEILIL